MNIIFENENKNDSCIEIFLIQLYIVVVGLTFFLILFRNNEFKRV